MADGSERASGDERIASGVERTAFGDERTTFGDERAAAGGERATGDAVAPHPDLSRTASYDYHLPDGLIARYPAERRDYSQLLVVPRGGRGSDMRHLRFADLPELLAPGDLVVLNESSVFPARLLGRKPTGAPSEILLLRRARAPAGGTAEPDPAVWEALVRPGSKLKPGRRVIVSDQLQVQILDGLEGGGRLVRLETPLPIDEALERFGHVPLPPYLEREAEPLDRERYQTVFARRRGSVAAPTAGLHFTPELLRTIEAAGVEVARVVLHVGPGTFRPIDVERVEEHRMHREWWEIPSAAARAVARARARGGRIWAVGTTVVRTLESAARERPDGEMEVPAGRGETELFIAPGYRFRVVDGLVTNFHLPRSSLIMLVSSFAGYDTTFAAYRTAIARGYRFYSYGDAMAVTPARDREKK